MLTIKHIAPSGEHYMCTARAIRYLEHERCLVLEEADTVRRLSGPGRYYVMNEVGKTVAKYEVLAAIPHLEPITAQVVFPRASELTTSRE